MSFRTELARIALKEINKLTLIQFQEFTIELDLCDMAAAEYNGVILQMFFPNPAAGYPKFRLAKTDITFSNPTTFFRNEVGEVNLNLPELIKLVNDYMTDVRGALMSQRKKD